MKRQIDFDSMFRDRLHDDRKTCTTRMHKKAEPLDTFTAFGDTFLVLNVFRTTLGQVSQYFYRQEGFAAPEGFEAFWLSLRPASKFPKSARVYIHHFTRIPAKSQRGGVP